MISSRPNPDDHRLREALRRPEPPTDLQARLLADLDEQVHEESDRPGFWRIGFALSLATNVVLASWLLAAAAWPPERSRTPAPIVDAYDHLQHEVIVDAQWGAGASAWLTAQGLGSPPPRLAGALMKDCAVGPLRAKHLRFATQAKQTIHVFVFEAGSSSPKGIVEGDIHSRRWVALRDAGTISALLFYDDLTSEAEAQELLKSVFSSRVATSS